MRILARYADAPRVPWRNGKGATCELVSWDRGRELSGGAAWRLSIADLIEPGEFSALPGVLRQFCPVGGSVILTVNGAQFPVPERTVARFTGDDDVDLIDLDRPCRAVNLMVSGPDADAPALVVGKAGDVLDGCMVAVALESGPGLDRFDLISPEPGAAAIGPAMVIAAVRTTG
jgi:environmental stress-induced protein Ves